MLTFQLTHAHYFVRTDCFDDASHAWLSFHFLTETLLCVVFPYVSLTSLLDHMLTHYRKAFHQVNIILIFSSSFYIFEHINKCKFV